MTESGSEPRTGTVRTREFAVDLATPLATAAGRIDRRQGWLIGVDAGDAVGVGEATPLPGWTESREACADALQGAVAALREFEDLPDPTVDATAPDSGDGSGHPALPDPSDAPAARHGLATALADLRARRAGVPLSRHLRNERGIDDEAVESVPVNATVGDAEPDATAGAARRAADSGFDCVKVKVGARSPDADLDRLRAVREAVGEGVAIRADANGAWDRPTAGEFLDRVSGVDPEYVEQPLPAGDLDGHATLRDRSPVDVAVDESLAQYPVDRIIEAGAADAVVCKPMALGGPDRALSVADRAAGAGVRTVVTTTVDAAPARTAAVHVAAALPDPPACGLATADRLATDLGTDPAPVEGGRIRVPDAPGVAAREVAAGWWGR
ncbi:o-succinylbenzoate synthase [Halobacteriales archaeon QS_8_69_26]|nr:MAG: o-succinylbenzoate synthase [Halobacteriales archaeon QS_8_69_26]